MWSVFGPPRATRAGCRADSALLVEHCDEQAAVSTAVSDYAEASESLRRDYSRSLEWLLTIHDWWKTVVPSMHADHRRFIADADPALLRPRVATCTPVVPQLRVPGCPAATCTRLSRSA